MSICKDCIHYEICDKYVSPNESFPEVDGCKCFKASADVVEVVHARWIGRKSRDYYTCSNCCTVSKSKDDEYCRGCGAKMDG